MQSMEHNGQLFALADSELRIQSAQDALDLMVTAQYELGSGIILVRRENLADAFFDLRSGLAGEILQKFSNYKTQLGIIGSVAGYTGNALHAFIRECNRGQCVFWADTMEDALAHYAAQRRQ